MTVFENSRVIKLSGNPPELEFTQLFLRNHVIMEFPPGRRPGASLEGAACLIALVRDLVGFVRSPPGTPVPLARRVETPKFRRPTGKKPFRSPKAPPALMLRRKHPASRARSPPSRCRDSRDHQPGIVSQKGPCFVPESLSASRSRRFPTRCTVPPAYRPPGRTERRYS